MVCRQIIEKGGCNGYLCNIGFIGGSVDTLTRLIVGFALLLFCGFSYAFGMGSSSEGDYFEGPCPRGGATASGNSAESAATMCLAGLTYSGSEYAGGCSRTVSFSPRIKQIMPRSGNTQVVRFESTKTYSACPNAQGVSPINIDSGEVRLVITRKVQCTPLSAEVRPGVCECVQGARPKGALCEPYQCGPSGSYSVVTQPDLLVSSVGPQCVAGCEVNPRMYKTAVDGKIYGLWPFVSVGKVCGGKAGADGVKTGETGEPPPVRCIAGQCPGTVGGTHVCVPCKDTSIPGPSTQASGAGGATGPGGVQIPDGGSSTTDTKCTDSSCSTTTTVRDKDGNVVGTKTDEKPKENFCQENPGLQICKEGKWGGSCGSYNCDGDAIQCALTREIHNRNCQLFETPNPLSEAGAAAMNNESTPEGHPGKNPGTKDLAGALTGQAGGSGGGGGGGCLPDKQVSFGGQSVVIPWTQACEPLRVMGHIAFAFALVHCAFFVVKKV